MTFEEAKSVINFMVDHPYIILRKMEVSCNLWWLNFKAVIEFMEEHLNDKDTSNLSSPLTQDETYTLQTGLLFLPAIMLNEHEDKAWEIYSAIVLICQNYASMLNDKNMMEITETLGSLIQAKNSWQTLMIQCESLVLQNQSMINSNHTPYNLSRKFLTSLLENEE